MRMEMAKTDCLEFLSQEMEGAINPVLDILDEQMEMFLIGGGVLTNIEDYKASPDIAKLEKKWVG